MSVGVVTGAASGMGSACMQRLLGSVDQLLAVDVRPIDHPGAVPVVCDVRDDQSVAALVDRVHELGAFRFLVNAAGLSPTMAEPRAIVDTNWVGTVRLLDGFDPLVTENSVAVLFSSSAGYLDAMLSDSQRELLGQARDSGVLDEVEQRITDSAVAYIFSKVGVQREARQAAPRWAERGGRVVSISPGNIDTPMGQLELEHQPLMREAQSTHPMSRMGDPKEIAAAVAFLVSEEASFVSGVDLLVDGAERARALSLP